jgi:hypothetical protein
MPVLIQRVAHALLFPEKFIRVAAIGIGNTGSVNAYIRPACIGSTKCPSQQS